MTSSCRPESGAKFDSTAGIRGAFPHAQRKAIQLGLATALIAVLTLGGGASAQQALISALSVDKSLTLPTNGLVVPGPDQAFLGQEQLLLGVYTGVQYNDNINASQIASESDIILNAGLHLGLLVAATDNSALHFGAAIGYLEYTEHPANSGLEIAPDSALTWQIKFEDGTLSLFDQFSYQQQNVQEPALANVASLPRLDNTIGARVNWEPKQWQLQAGYSYDYFISPNTTYSYLDRSSDYFFTREAWRFAESTAAGVEGSISLTHYLKSNQGPSQSYSAGPYGQWQVTRSIFATARAGPLVDVLDSSGPTMPRTTLNSYYLGLTINDNLTDIFTHSLDVERQTALGLNQSSGYIESTTATYSFSLSITPRISFSGVASYQKGNQPLSVPVPEAIDGFPIVVEGSFNEKYYFYGGGPALTWRMTDKLSSSLHYNRWRRDSDLAGRGFTQDIISLNLSYIFW
jgi:hypothetical protein